MENAPSVLPRATKPSAGLGRFGEPQFRGVDAGIMGRRNQRTDHMAERMGAERHKKR